jgi:hypothetical protein
MKLKLKQYLVRWLLCFMIGKANLHRALALVEDARRTLEGAFARRGYVYREMKKHCGELTTKELNLAVELVVNLDHLLYGNKRAEEATA